MTTGSPVMGAGKTTDCPRRENASDRISVLRGRVFSNLMEVCQRSVRTFTDNITADFKDSDQAMFGALAAAVDAHVW